MLPTVKRQLSDCRRVCGGGGEWSVGDGEGGDARYIHLFVCMARCQKYCQLSLKEMAIPKRQPGSRTQYINLAAESSHGAKPVIVSWPNCEARLWLTRAIGLLADTVELSDTANV